MRERLKGRLKGAAQFGLTTAVALPLVSLACFFWWLSMGHEGRGDGVHYY
jgi:hypothetical protein